MKIILTFRMKTTSSVAIFYYFLFRQRERIKTNAMAKGL